MNALDRKLKKIKKKEEEELVNWQIKNVATEKK